MDRPIPVGVARQRKVQWPQAFYPHLYLEEGKMRCGTGDLVACMLVQVFDSFLTRNGYFNFASSEGKRGKGHTFLLLILTLASVLHK